MCSCCCDPVAWLHRGTIDHRPLDSGSRPSEPPIVFGLEPDVERAIGVCWSDIRFQHHASFIDTAPSESVSRRAKLDGLPDRHWTSGGRVGRLTPSQQCITNYRQRTSRAPPQRHCRTVACHRRPRACISTQADAVAVVRAANAVDRNVAIARAAFTARNFQCARACSRAAYLRCGILAHG